jgi:hypothetical protein
LSTSSLYRGESRPRRQAPRHHIETSAAAHQIKPVNDPFPPISSKQFPALYIHDPVKNQYRSYMRAKSAYRRT